jgi:hypothetical protein
MFDAAGVRILQNYYLLKTTYPGVRGLLHLLHCVDNMETTVVPEVPTTTHNLSDSLDCSSILTHC